MFSVLHLLEATGGGTRLHVIDLLTGLHTKHSDEVELHFGYSLRRADSNFKSALKYLKLTNMKCFECDMTREISPISDIKKVVQVANYVKANKIDIVHAHSAKAGYIGRLAAKSIRGTRSVYTPNASPFRLSLMYHLLEIVAGLIFTDTVIAVSESEKDELIAAKIIKKSKVHVINSGISDSENVSEFNSKTLDKESDIFTVGTVGRLTAQKAPFRFLDIAQAVVRQKPSVQFVWIGDGELRKEVERSIKNKGLSKNVCITGWTESPDKALQQLDIFLLASEYESFGYATVEAMRAGLPSIVSNVCGSRDLVRNGETGFTVELSNTNDYVDTIFKLLNDTHLRKTMGEAGRDRWRREFNVTQMVSNTLELYRTLMQ